jgi:hypothetical protein
MRKTLLTGLIACALVGVASPSFAGDQDFTLINKTGLVLDQVYISPANVDDWEEDVLSKDVLEDGESFELEFDGHNQCKFDMKVVDDNGKDHIFYDIDLCKLTKLTLHREGSKFTYRWVNE